MTSIRRSHPTCPALLALLDIAVEDPTWQALDATQRRQRTLDSLKRLFLRNVSSNPVMLVFEDLHWIDRETQAFLETLIDSVACSVALADPDVSSGV